MLNKKFKKYSIEIELEEILLDKKAPDKLEVPLRQTGFVIIFAIAVFVISAFFARAFWLQIWKGNYYVAQADRNSVRLYHSQAPRGIIYDRNGKILAENIPDFDILVIPTDLPKKQDALEKWVKQFSDTVKREPAEIKNFLKTLNFNSAEPAVFNFELNQAALIELEANMAQLPGLFIDKKTKRHYLDGDLFAHLMGYVGKVSSGDLNKDAYYSMLDVIGKDGLEIQYEEKLRGVPGKIAVSVNSDSAIAKTVTVKEAKPGNNLILSVNSDLQKLLTAAVSAKMVDTNAPGAAAVVVDVNSGEILSMASFPSFDNNIFSGKLAGSAYQKLISNNNSPLINRAISGFYPAGSTIKPFIASAALAENTIDPDYKIDDTLGYIKVPNEYNPDIIYTYRDWKPHGFIDMRRALAVSANVYFYEIGGGYKNIKGLGIDRIEKYLRLFGFGSLSGIDLPGETPGLVPNPEWKKAHKNENWYTGDTYNVSIGQGDIIITPLQLVTGMAAIANGGTLWRPRMVSQITDQNNNIVEKFNPEAIKKNVIDNDKLQIVREGLRDAVTEGSIRLLNDLPIAVAGKTGTAQVQSNFSKTNAWFTGFAPYDNPQIAVAVVVEGVGEGSAVAVPIAKQVFQWYYDQNRDNIIK